MLLRRRSRRHLRIVAVSLLTYLCSIAPASASVVYCISDDGHAGFELVAGGEHGCASCCHDDPADQAHEGFVPEPSECTDVAISSDQAVRPVVAADPPGLVFDSALDIPVQLVDGCKSIVAESLRVTLAPPRGAPASMIRCTVLLI